jgi:transcriptional regulator with XRE-family HTH domain
MKDIHSPIRTEIKRLLQARGKSAEKVAYEVGMSKEFLYAYLRGQKKASLESLVKIADGLDVKLKDLLPDL